MRLGKHIIMGLIISIMALSSLAMARNTAAEDGTTALSKATPLPSTSNSDSQPTPSLLSATSLFPNSISLGQESGTLGSAEGSQNHAASTSPTQLLTTTVSPTDVPAIEPTFGASAAMQGEVQITTQESDAALQAVLGVQTYFWHQTFGTPIRMIRSNDGICYLTLVRGRFQGAGEKVTIANRDGYWWLEGESKQEGVAAEATCVPFFTIKRSHALRYTIRPAIVWLRAGECPPLIACGYLTEYGVTIAPISDYCYLTGMGGHFRGGGEWVSILHTTRGWYLMVKTGVEGGYIRAEAGCISLVGNPNQRVSGPRTWARGASPVSLAGTDAAFCSLSRVQGSYHSVAFPEYRARIRASATGRISSLREAAGISMGARTPTKTTAPRLVATTTTSGQAYLTLLPHLRPRCSASTCLFLAEKNSAVQEQMSHL
jgi:hypothetical protein